MYLSAIYMQCVLLQGREGRGGEGRGACLPGGGAVPETLFIGAHGTYAPSLPVRYTAVHMTYIYGHPSPQDTHCIYIRGISQGGWGPPPCNLTVAFLIHLAVLCCIVYIIQYRLIL